MEPEPMEVQQPEDRQQYKLQSGVWQNTDKLKRKDAPKGRYNHLSFFYKNCLYIHGGHSSSLNDLEDQTNVLHRLQLDSNRWEKIEITKPQSVAISNAATLEVLSSHCGIVYKDQLIIFGGSNSKAECKNDLLSIHLQNYTMKVLDQKGDAPSPRESSSMILYKGQWLVLYGGVNFQNIEVYNDFHFYNMLSRTWIRCEGSYQYLIQARSTPALCLSPFNDKIYLFGGQYINSQGETKFLNDFYEITPRIKNKSSPIGIDLTRVLTNHTPASRSGHSLISFKTQYLVLLGGENYYISKDKNANFDQNKNLYTRNDVWVFNIKDREWVKIEPSGDFFRFRTCFSACQGTSLDKIFVFGGMKTYDSIYKDLMLLDMSEVNFEEWFDLKDKNNSVSCRMCYEKKNNMILPPFALEEEYVKSVVNQIEFPFSAFGILFDNFVLTNASMVNVLFEENADKQKYLRIEDNGKMLTGDDIFHSLVNFDMGINVVTQGLDKRMKHIIMKDTQRKEIGANLKLGALRLGEQFLYITTTPNQEQVRVILYSKEKIEQQNRYQYLCYFYGFCPETNKTLPGYSDIIRQKIQDKYKNDILSALERNTFKNTLYIYKLRKVLIEASHTNKLQEEYQLLPNYITHDLMYGNKYHINSLEKAGYSIFQCCDVSLKAYLTLLFLKNETMKIFLGVRANQRKEVSTQVHLDKIDRMLKAKMILDLEGMIDHDCKIVELYYNPDLKRKVNSFHNGVLIYHKGRLITRYKYKLGQLIETNFTETLLNKNNLVSLFGYIDVPQVIPVNLFKTDFTYDIMMENLYSRIKLVWKYLDRKNSLTGGIRSLMKRNDRMERMDKFIEKTEKEKKAEERSRYSRRADREYQGSPDQMRGKHVQSSYLHGQDFLIVRQLRVSPIRPKAADRMDEEKEEIVINSLSQDLPERIIIDNSSKLEIEIEDDPKGQRHEVASKQKKPSDLNPINPGEDLVKRTENNQQNKE